MNPDLILVLIGLLYLGQALLAGRIARKRKHSFWFWFVVALILIFPIGFVAVLIYTKDPNIMI